MEGGEVPQPEEKEVKTGSEQTEEATKKAPSPADEPVNDEDDRKHRALSEFTSAMSESGAPPEQIAGIWRILDDAAKASEAGDKEKMEKILEEIDTDNTELTEKQQDIISAYLNARIENVDEGEKSNEEQGDDEQPSSSTEQKETKEEDPLAGYRETQRRNGMPEKLIEKTAAILQTDELKTPEQRHAFGEKMEEVIASMTKAEARVLLEHSPIPFSQDSIDKILEHAPEKRHSEDDFFRETQIGKKDKAQIERAESDADPKIEVAKMTAAELLRQSGFDDDKAKDAVEDAVEEAVKVNLDRLKKISARGGKIAAYSLLIMLLLYIGAMAKIGSWVPKK